MALISIEDLAELEDEYLDDVTQNSEPMEDNDEERLYAHWQAVASMHQVSVPREMIGPIQEMTRRNQAANEREEVPSVTLSRHEKLGESVYEERIYPPGRWACVTRTEKLYEQSISMGFMKLMRYICKENSTGRYLGMTLPIVTELQMLEDGNGFLKEVVTAYYLPAALQDYPPEPADPDIYIIHRDTLRVFTRSFRGTTTEETIMNQANQLWELLENTEGLRRDAYMVAVYENPGVSCRRNEIWFIRQEQ
ncbi:LOW QUALITY PROTEIN: heme-binding protein soul4 [Paramormyrops kingsleyae]|uniref:LOW QUALITY PROTEIN: heme-binding protein soul4 n=1 Tax=Paramormyrops kingsleyae TaxID=1676925 RepID=UPI003B96F212